MGQHKSPRHELLQCGALKSSVFVPVRAVIGGGEGALFHRALNRNEGHIGKTTAIVRFLQLQYSFFKETCLDTPETIRDGKEPFVNNITYALKEVITVIDEQDISKHINNDWVLAMPLPPELELEKVKLNTFNRMSLKVNKFVI